MSPPRDDAPSATSPPREDSPPEVSEASVEHTAGIAGSLGPYLASPEASRSPRVYIPTDSPGRSPPTPPPSASLPSSPTSAPSMSLATRGASVGDELSPGPLQRVMFGSESEGEGPTTAAGTATVPGASATSRSPFSEGSFVVPRQRCPRVEVIATLSAAPGTVQTGFTPAVTDVADVAEGSRRVSELGNLFLLPGFTAPDAQECWCLLQNLIVPDIPAEDSVSPCSEADMTAFVDWINPTHL